MLPLFVGVLCLIRVMFLVICVHLVCNHLNVDERAGCFILIVFLMSGDSQCYVAVSHGAVGWSVCLWYYLVILTCF